MARALFPDQGAAGADRGGEEAGPRPEGLARERHTVRGQVQGVGFRPFVFALAQRLGLSGFVQNTPEGVLAEVQGPPDALAAFSAGLDRNRPPRSRVTARREERIPPRPEEKGFSIARTTRGSGHTLLVSPDIALCADCRAEIRDPANRRRGYAFTNCTNCGPRYTVTRSMPYDRSSTSMACFPLCPECRREYEDPRDRRFHAQPNACPACGPRLWFTRGGEAETCGAPEGAAAIRAAAGLIREGGILALKGLGGFHLACAADQGEAVARLRRRKNRPHKPFALMLPDLAAARRIARLGPAEIALLTGAEQPIVLCPLRENPPLAAGVAPDLSLAGLILAYTPLHQILLDAYADLGADPPALVMTSGNREGEPICLGNREALTVLRDMADAFLLHTRDILVRVDDSVVCPLPDGTALFFRRARGYVPRPLALSDSFSVNHQHFSDNESVIFPSRQGALRAFPAVLGLGADLKNTICLTRGTDAFVSQHIGDLSNPETAAFQREAIAHLAGLLHVRPEAVVRDLHPDFSSSRQAEETGLPVLRLQHHYAHAHALLAEHRPPAGGQADAPALVLTLDGTGLGEDGHIWGGEILFLRPACPGKEPEHQRLAHLAPLPLPGGDAAAREPWRLAHGLLTDLNLAADDPLLPWLPEQAKAAALLSAMIRSGLNTPRATSCGRLFDATAALLGLCLVSTYEGQAATLLEEAQAGFPSPAERPYPCPWTAPAPGAACWQLDSHTLFRAVWEDRRRGLPAALLSRRFHLGLAAGFVDLAARLGAGFGVKRIGLTGGCLQNRTLARLLAQGLENRGFTPLLPRAYPPHDGSISLGQAVWGRLTLLARSAG
ncbi:MAG: carbamoyltransferase HypF [Desulfovibrio sp.]|jgi:hydrogenase maturation protein HypF|nr:carbamoyltransferase HypF [Desulfovibrio sp.]